MACDPVIAEIRAVRERLAAECHYDFHQMCNRAEETLRTWPGKVVTKAELAQEKPAKRGDART